MDIAFSIVKLRGEPSEPATLTIPHFYIDIILLKTKEILSNW